MKKVIPGLLMTMLIFAACSDKNDPPPQNLPYKLLAQQYRVQLAGKSKVEDTLILDFVYNPDSTVKEIHNWRNGTYFSKPYEYITYNTYENGKLVKTEFRALPGSVRRLRETYEYKEERLSKLTTYFDSGEVASKDTLKYDAQGLLVERNVESYSPGSQPTLRTVRYTWNGLNIVRENNHVTYPNMSSYTSTTTYTYGAEGYIQNMFKQDWIRDAKGRTISFNHPSGEEIVGSDGITYRKTYEIKLNTHGQFDSMHYVRDSYRNNVFDDNVTEKYKYTYQ